jgi:hypothetical protein
MTKWVADIRSGLVEELEDDETLGFEQFTYGHDNRQDAVHELCNGLQRELLRAENEVKRIRKLIEVAITL